MHACTHYVCRVVYALLLSGLIRQARGAFSFATKCLSNESLTQVSALRKPNKMLKVRAEFSKCLSGLDFIYNVRTKELKQCWAAFLYCRQTANAPPKDTTSTGSLMKSYDTLGIFVEHPFLTSCQ